MTYLSLTTKTVWVYSPHRQAANCPFNSKNSVTGGGCRVPPISYRIYRIPKQLETNNSWVGRSWHAWKAVNAGATSEHLDAGICQSVRNLALENPPFVHDVPPSCSILPLQTWAKLIFGQGTPGFLRFIAPRIASFSLSLDPVNARHTAEIPRTQALHGKCHTTWYWDSKSVIPWMGSKETKGYPQSAMYPNPEYIPEYIYIHPFLHWCWRIKHPVLRPLCPRC